MGGRIPLWLHHISDSISNYFSYNAHHPLFYLHCIHLWICFVLLLNQVFCLVLKVTSVFFPALRDWTLCMNHISFPLVLWFNDYGKIALFYVISFIFLVKLEMLWISLSFSNEKHAELKTTIFSESCGLPADYNFFLISWELYPTEMVILHFSNITSFLNIQSQTIANIIRHTSFIRH